MIVLLGCQKKMLHFCHRLWGRCGWRQSLMPSCNEQHLNKPKTGWMTQSCKSLNQKETVQSGSQPVGTELPEALLTVSVSVVLSTNRCAISWAMWPHPKNISKTQKLSHVKKIKVINQHNYVLRRGWKYQNSTSWQMLVQILIDWHSLYKPRFKFVLRWFATATTCWVFLLNVSVARHRPMPRWKCIYADIVSLQSAIDVQNTTHMKKKKCKKQSAKLWVH